MHALNEKDGRPVYKSDSKKTDPGSNKEARYLLYTNVPEKAGNNEMLNLISKVPKAKASFFDQPPYMEGYWIITDCIDGGRAWAKIRSNGKYL